MLSENDVVVDAIMEHAKNGEDAACRALWLRVIHAAKAEVESANVKTSTKCGFLRRVHQIQALNFLRGKTGELEQVCELAGVSSTPIKKWANNYRMERV